MLRCRISAFQEAIFGCRIVFIRRSCDKIKAVFFCIPLRKMQSESCRAASLKLFFYKKHGYVCFPFAHRPHSLATHCFLRLSRVCGRSSKEECLPLFVLFVLFGQAKSTLCFMYFCMTKSTKSHLRGSLLEISLSFPTCQSALSVSAVSAHRLHARPPHLYMRAWIFAYANLLGYFV